MKSADIFLQKRSAEAAADEIRASRRSAPTEPIYRTTLHWHDYFELELILDGRGEHRLNGRSYPVTRGDVFLLTPQDLHTLVEHPETPLQLYNLNFDEAALPRSMAEELIAQGEEIAFRLDEASTTEAAALFERLLEEQERASQPFHRERSRALLTDLLVLILRRSAPAQKIATHTEKDPIRETIAHLRTHFREPLTLEDCAARVFLTAGYLGELFYRSTGVHFKEYLGRLRFEYALRLLLTTTLSIHAIAQEAGFSTPSYFISVFRARYGKTPSEYRRANRS